MGKVLQFVCERCANYENGRIAFKPSQDSIPDAYLDGELASFIKMSPSKAHKCSECRKPTKAGWRHDV